MRENIRNVAAGNDQTFGSLREKYLFLKKQRCSNQRRNRLRRCFKNSQISAFCQLRFFLKEQRRKLWLKSMCIRELSLLKLNAKMYLTSTGKGKLNFTGEVSNKAVL